MNITPDHMDELMGKVLAGEATIDEKSIVEKWIAEDDANRKYFEQLQTIFTNAASVNVEMQFDADAAWNKVKGKITREKKSVHLKAGKTWSPLRIAAGMLILMTSAWLIWTFTRPVLVERSLSASSTLATDTLPDGSKTFLNHKSKLTYRDVPGAQKRSVVLSGEAYFEVKHTEEKPFVIEADELLIRDIGTSFNVMAYPERSTIEVSVEEGEVQLYTLSNSGMALKAGEKGIYDKLLKTFSKIEKIDTNVLAYKTKLLRFNNTDMRSVIALINSVYESNIVLADEALNDCRLTVNFNNDGLDTIIDVLSETMTLTVSRKESKIILSGAGCAHQ